MVHTTFPVSCQLNHESPRLRFGKLQGMRKAAKLCSLSFDLFKSLVHFPLTLKYSYSRVPGLQWPQPNSELLLEFTLAPPALLPWCFSPFFMFSVSFHALPSPDFTTPLGRYRLAMLYCPTVSQF